MRLRGETIPTAGMCSCDAAARSPVRCASCARSELDRAGWRSRCCPTTTRRSAPTLSSSSTLRARVRTLCLSRSTYENACLLRPAEPVGGSRPARLPAGKRSGEGRTRGAGAGTARDLAKLAEEIAALKAAATPGLEARVAAAEAALATFGAALAGVETRLSDLSESQSATAETVESLESAATRAIHLTTYGTFAIEDTSRSNSTFDAESLELVLSAQPHRVWGSSPSSSSNAPPPSAASTAARSCSNKPGRAFVSPTG